MRPVRGRIAAPGPAPAPEPSGEPVVRWPAGQRPLVLKTHASAADTVHGPALPPLPDPEAVGSDGDARPDAISDAWRRPPPYAILAPPTPAFVASLAAALSTLPIGHLVKRHRRPRREQLRRLRGLAVDDELAQRLLGEASSWSRALISATAAGWAELAIARGAQQQALDCRVLARSWQAVATPAGQVIAASCGTRDGDAQALIDGLEQERERIQPQRRSTLPWLHLVGSYGRPCGPQQMLHDAVSLLRGIALLPEERPWALFGHANHWHVIASRIGLDGRSWKKTHNLTTRLTVDVLEAESGWRSGFDAPGSWDGRSSLAYRRLAQGTLANQLHGSAAAGSLSMQEVPVQGPAWAGRLAQLAPMPGRVGGLLVLTKPSYQDLSYIVPHCVDG